MVFRQKVLLWSGVGFSLAIPPARFLLLKYAQNQYVEVAVNSAKVFHRHFSLSDNAQIYWSADPLWRHATSLEDQARIFRAIKERTGNCIFKGKPDAWQVNIHNAQTFVNLTYDAECNRTNIRETSVWHIVSKTGAQLVSSHIDGVLAVTGSANGQIKSTPVPW